MSKKLVAILVIGILAILITLGVNRGIEQYNQDMMKTSDNGIGLGVDDSEKDRLDIDALVQSFDPAKGEVIIRYEFSPQGEYSDEFGRFKRKIIIETNSEQGNIEFKKGEWPKVTYATYKIFDGILANYPYDVHSLTIDLIPYSYLAGQQEEDAESVPVNMSVKGTSSGLKLEFKELPPEKDFKELAGCYCSYEIKASRSTATKGTAVFVIIMLWMMSLSVVAITLTVVIGGRKLEFGSFAWIGAMLFAFFSFRSAAPGIPPIGGYFDFVSFFWVLLLVALCLVVLVATYIVRKEAK
ncbi:MAG: DUF4436 domain-containing protein [Firmicutes bacterium]|nr:DUF4436 domain-containing protein [Bacillota bacterium]